MANVANDPRQPLLRPGVELEGQPQQNGDLNQRAQGAAQAALPNAALVEPAVRINHPIIWSKFPETLVYYSTPILLRFIFSILWLFFALPFVPLMLAIERRQNPFEAYKEMFRIWKQFTIEGIRQELIFASRFLRGIDVHHIDVPMLPGKYREPRIFPMREALDPLIDPSHFRKIPRVEALPPLPREVNLDDLVIIGKELKIENENQLTRFVNNVKNGCQGLVGVPRDLDPFKDRLQILVKHIIVRLQDPQLSNDNKLAACIKLTETGAFCAPRHMQDAELVYSGLTGQNQVLTTADKFYKLCETLRIESVDKITAFNAGGYIHYRTGVLRILGEQFQIPGDSNEMFRLHLNPELVRMWFFAQYTKEALIQRVDQAINTNPKLREIPVDDEFIDLIKVHIPENWQPKRALDEDEKMDEKTIAYEYLNEHAYQKDRKALSLEGIENLLIGLKILK